MPLLFDLDIQFPLNEPVLIIALLLLLILLGPVIFERFRIPSVVGLLLLGALFGPHGLNLFSPDLEFSLLATFGLLYLMFLAGLEIDLVDFIQNQRKSILFGVLSFLIPFVFGFLSCYYVLGFSLVASLFIASMLSSHTLISYPVATRLRIVSTTIVTVIIGGTIITDILALTSMELITELSHNRVYIGSVLELLLSFGILVLIVFLIVPRITAFFFRHYDGELTTQYLFVIGQLFGIAGIAYLLNIEPIVGAFLCGIVMNRYMVRSSPLYKRTEFIGEVLFIPVFLLSVGFLVDFTYFINQPSELLILGGLLVVSVLSKYIAAWITGYFFGLDRTDRGIMFGMSTGRAASAIAIVLIGYNLDFYSEAILNHTVIVILVTSIVSSYVTLHTGKKVALHQERKTPKKKVDEVILIPIANPANIEPLLDFANLIRDPDHQLPVYALSVVADHIEEQERIGENQKRFTQVVNELDSDTRYELLSRIDSSVSHGISRAAREILASCIVIGWHNRHSPLELLFGDVLNHLLKRTNQMIWVVRPADANHMRAGKIHVFYPDYVWYEKGFSSVMMKLRQLARNLKSTVDLYTTEETIGDSEQLFEDSLKGNFNQINTLSFRDMNFSEIAHEPNDWVMIIRSRENSIAFNRNYEKLCRGLIDHFPDQELILVYPETEV